MIGASQEMALLVFFAWTEVALTDEVAVGLVSAMIENLIGFEIIKCELNF